MFCEKCGTKLDDGVKFCSKCGAPVPRPAVQAPCCARCGAPLTPGNSFCMKCGAPIPGRAPQTAAPVNAGKAPKAPKPPKPPKQKKQKQPDTVSSPGVPVPGGPSPTVDLSDTSAPGGPPSDAPAGHVPQPPASGKKGRKTAAIIAIVLAGILLIGAGIGAVLRFGPSLLSRTSDKTSPSETAEAPAGTPDADDTPDATDAPDATGAEATPAPTPVPEEGPAPAASWQDRYRSLLQADHAGTLAEYALFDMDADGTPELILRLDYTHFLFYAPDSDSPVYDYPGTDRTSVEIDPTGTGLCLMESGEGGSLIVYELTLADGAVARDTSYTGPWSASLFGDTYLVWSDAGDLSALDAYAS